MQGNAPTNMYRRSAGASMRYTLRADIGLCTSAALRAAQSPAIATVSEFPSFATFQRRINSPGACTQGNGPSDICPRCQASIGSTPGADTGICTSATRRAAHFPAICLVYLVGSLALPRVRKSLLRRPHARRRPDQHVSLLWSIHEVHATGQHWTLYLGNASCRPISRDRYS